MNEREQHLMLVGFLAVAAGSVVGAYVHKLAGAAWRRFVRPVVWGVLSRYHDYRERRRPATAELLLRVEERLARIMNQPSAPPAPSKDKPAASSWRFTSRCPRCNYTSETRLTFENYSRREAVSFPTCGHCGPGSVPTEISVEALPWLT